MIHARRIIETIKPYIPGKPIEEVKRELGIEGKIVKIASNENPLGPSPAAMEAILKCVPDLHIYPDDSVFYLRRKLAHLWNIEEETILMGNGSAELIHYIATTFLEKGDEIILSKPSFIMGKISAQLMDANIKEIPIGKDYKHDLSAILSAITDKTKIIYIDNPNNPLGTYIEKNILETFLKDVPNNILILLDQAYYEYIEGKDKLMPDYILNKYSNVILLHTFSKVYGLAGLRIGYALGNKRIVNYLLRVKLPFNVNSIAQFAASKALDDKDHIKLSIEGNKKNMQYLTKEMDKRQRKYLPSYANFLTIYTPEGSIEVFERLQKKGVIIRPLKAYDMDDWIRVSIGLDEELKTFVDKFDEVINEIKGE